MPLSLIGEVIDKLKEAKHFNKLDLIWEYDNIQIKEEDEWKAAFLTKAYLNLKSCTLGFAIYLEPFKGWWTIYSESCYIKGY